MNQDAIRKAAILIAAADRETADTLLDRLDPEQAAAVRRCAIQLQEADVAESDDVFSEFAQRHVGKPSTVAQAYAASSNSPERIANPLAPTPKANRLVPDQDPGGIDLGSDAVIHLRLPNSSFSQIDQSQDVARSLDDSLTQTSPTDLAAFLKGENAQTIAVVFSRLASPQASAVLEKLPAARRADVLHRLARLDEPSEEVIQEVEATLHNWLRDQAKRAGRRRAGVSAAIRILEATDGGMRRELLSDLAERDSDLVSQVQRNVMPANTMADGRDDAETAVEPLSLDQIAHLNSDTLIRILDACHRETLVLALAAADPKIVSDLLAVLGLSDGRQLREEIASLGPVRLSDVDESQRQLGLLAAELSQPVLNTSTSAESFLRAA